jgi:hypothetical protein
VKIVGIILAAMMLFSAVYVGVTGSSKSMDLGDNVVSISGSLSEAEMDAAGLPSAGRLRFGGIISILAALSALTLLVVTLVSKEKIPTVAIATLALSLLAVALYPTFENGPPADMAPRVQALVATALALLGAAGSMMVKKASERGHTLST